MVIKKTKTKKSSTSKPKTRKVKAKIVHKKRKQNKIMPIVGIIGLVLIIILGSYYVASTFNSSSEDEVLVVVNGDKILQSELDETWDTIPVETKASLSRNQLLDELIVQELLLQKVEEKGIQITEDEVNEYIAMQLEGSGNTIEDFEKQVEAKGISMDSLREIYREQLAISTLFDDYVLSDIEPSEEEIEEYYQENREKFFQDDSVTVKHILIGVSENLQDAEASKLVNEVLDEYNSGTEFCELVSEYSMDLASVEDCGEYTFPKGEMMPQFEDASFELEIGETEIVKTDYGYHLILKEGFEKGKDLNLDDEVLEYEMNVSELIKSILTQERAAAIYDSYVSTLKEDATIEYKNEAVEEETGDLASFANCLADKGAKMYGAYWCSYCNAQKEEFGDASEVVPYVECDQEGENSEHDLCVEKGIEGFPTWIINGEKYSGKQTQERLSQLTGCPL